MNDQIVLSVRDLTVRFGGDGFLYVSLGEDNNPSAAQDTSILGGKILRLDVSRLPDGPGSASRELVTPPDNPLLKLDNVILTAHLAGPTFESNITRLRNGFDNVQRVARGEPALWVVPELLE